MPRATVRPQLVVLILAAIAPSLIGATLTIYNDTSVKLVIPTYNIQRTVPFTSIEGPAIMLMNPSGKQPIILPNATTSGRLAILERMDSAKFESWAISDAIVTANFSAFVLIDSDLESLGSVGTELSFRRNMKVPLVMIESNYSSLVMALFYNSSNALQARLIHSNVKATWWAATDHGMFWFCVIFLFWLQIAFIMLCIFRLVEFRRTRYRVEFNGKVAIIVILLEMLASIARLLYWAIDPMGQRGLIMEAPRKVLHSTPLPFTILATILLTMYWHHLLSRSTQFRLLLSVKTFRKPAIALACIMFAFEIAVDVVVLKGLTVRALDMARSGFYLVIAVLLISFFIITSARVLKALHDTAAANHGSDTIEPIIKQLAGPAAKFVGVACLLIGAVGAGFATLAPNFSTRWKPSYIIPVWVAIHTFFTLKAMLIVAVLRPALGASNGSPPAGSISTKMTLHPGSMTAGASSTMFADCPTPEAPSASLALSPRIYSVN